MALFTESMLSSASYDLPENTTGTPAHPNDMITLQLSDGTMVSVFDKLTTGLRLLTYMRTHAQWQVAPIRAGVRPICAINLPPHTHTACGTTRAPP